MPKPRHLALLLLLAAGATAQESKCTCRDGNGSYLYLLCPKAPPADPDPCPATHDGIHPHVAAPHGWDPNSWSSQRWETFLLRHATSWRIACSLCAEDDFGGLEKERGLLPGEITEIGALVQEQRELGGRGIEMAMSPHFVIVTDIASLKIATARGAPRIARQHEILHLYLQRAEMARRDFEATFGTAYHGRSAMVIVRSENTRMKFSQHYFGSPRTNVLRGYGAGKTVAGGKAGNGFAISGREDDDLHFRTRHLIGHLLISTYMGANPHEKYLPQWVDKGCAHWLCKLHPRATNYATFCQHEGVGTTGGGGTSPGAAGGLGGGGVGGRGRGGGGGPAVSGSGARWDLKARKIALRGSSRDPVEAMFQASTAKEMDFDMHVRAWSWYDVFTREDPEPFVRFIQMLRRAEEARVAAKGAWGQAPELVDERWRERVLGKRRSVAATDEDIAETDVGTASSRELDDIAREEDLQLLAGRIRGLERCQSVNTARMLVTLVDTRDSDRVREVIALVLARTTDEEVRTFLREEGFDKAGKLGRATLCRIFGEIKDEQAVTVLRDALQDSFWLVQANAARALALLGDAGSIPTLADMAARSSAGKVRIAAMDALAAFGKEAEDTIPAFERNLMHRDWQVKVATCDAFRGVGSPRAVDMLIGRIDMEGGRVHDEIRQALKALTGMDRDWDADMWRKYWKKAQRFRELEEKMEEELAEEGKTPGSGGGGTYAQEKKPPTYYGIRVYARTVGYVLDVSDSMRQGFRISPAWEDRLGRTYEASTRIGVCKEELAASIRGLDPRTRFNLYFFNTKARVWQSTPVVAGAMADQGVSTVENIQPELQTNYYDALRLVLGMEGSEGGWSSSFADTPDTLFFLTDGEPTDGEITKADELLAWFNERNRFARLKVHVIAMGTTGVDREFLSRFATDNGGTFLHLTGTY